MSTKILLNYCENGLINLFPSQNLALFFVHIAYKNGARFVDFHRHENFFVKNS